MISSSDMQPQTGSKEISYGVAISHSHIHECQIKGLSSSFLNVKSPFLKSKISQNFDFFFEIEDFKKERREDFTFK